MTTTTRLTKKQLLGDKKRKPAKVIPDYNNLPAYLKEQPRWINWNWEWMDDRGLWDKPPFSPHNGSANGWQTPEARGTLTQAAEGLRKYDASGLGFVMVEDERCLVALDLDDCVDAATGEIVDWPNEKPKGWKKPLSPRQIMAALGGYWEFSVSGTGLRGFVFCPGVDVGRLGNKTQAEFYISAKYLTVSGRRIDPISGEPANGSCEIATVDAPVLNGIMAEFGDSKQEKEEKAKKAAGKRNKRTVVADDDCTPTAEKVIGAARAASNAEKFCKLWEGDISEYSGDHSKADSALCCLVAFYAGPDEQLIDEVFRQSKLMRPKWDEVHGGDGATYGAMTVHNSLSVVTEFYKWTPPPSLSNVGTRTEVDEDGTERKVNYPLSIDEIMENVRTQTGDWPRRVGDQPFVDEGHRITWLSDADSAFGYFHAGIGKVTWHDGPSLVRRRELYSRLRQTGTAYDAIEHFPHFPPMPGHYYSHPEVKLGNGEALQDLLAFYCPATPIDRDLICASYVTLFWGGACGARPAFVVTSPDGRGVGKSKLAMHAGMLTGGVFDFSNGEDTATIKKRLLTATAAIKRVCLIDNIKVSKFSWPEAEAMLTSNTISGHQLYNGERDRPNSLSWYLTLNGPGMSRDYAQRSVIIQLKRPVYSGTWEEDVATFIQNKRWEIIADVAAYFQQPAKKLANCSRWGLWERDVLGRLPDPYEAQAVIAERQAEVDVDEDEAGEVEDYISQQLERCGYDPAEDWIHIPNEIAAKWIMAATNQKVSTTGMKRMIRQWADEGMAKRLAENPCRSSGRGLLWRGGNASRKVSYVLPERMEEFKNIF